MADEKSNIYAQLRAAQVELKVPKNQRNNFGGYNYRSAEDIVEAAKPVLAKHGLTLTLSDAIEMIGERYYVHATAGVFEDGGERFNAEGYAREEESKKGMDGSQITGAASSYARKYALNGLLAIDDTKDADSNEHRVSTQRPAPKPAARPASNVASGSQKATITALMRGAGHTDEEIVGLLKDTYGVDKEHPMTADQAKQIIADFRAEAGDEA